MIGFLLDTNVISELRKPRPNPDVVSFVTAQAEDDLFLSDVVFGEIRFGIEQLVDAEKRASIATWLNHSLRPLFEGRTLPIGEDTILRWRLKVEAGRRRGHTFGQPDLFVAVLGEEHDLIVVTRDVTHFVEAGVPVLDPWTARFITAAGKSHPTSDLAAGDLLAELTRLNHAVGKI